MKCDPVSCCHCSRGGEKRKGGEKREEEEERDRYHGSNGFPVRVLVAVPQFPLLPCSPRPPLSCFLPLASAHSEHYFDLFIGGGP